MGGTLAKLFGVELYMGNLYIKKSNFETHIYV